MWVEGRVIVNFYVVFGVLVIVVYINFLFNFVFYCWKMFEIWRVVKKFLKDFVLQIMISCYVIKVIILGNYVYQYVIE